MALGPWAGVLQEMTWCEAEPCTQGNPWPVVMGLGWGWAGWVEEESNTGLPCVDIKTFSPANESQAL
jgi:hypothetical protein